ncbi:heavy metal-associated isoprenylated plant protein 28-like isoform X2 [Juglans microcarpa x Juglans regia]|uniref:heavy metal-associated isoprenylated plant protein 28-like isoform X2 n=1 Tax=Juglans microcarpa x Juglans regia TaxID=2249226 RepID=UPI001B7E5259|nr:heavy metal-associated isoprenylated plant protein 28-like isoform X2 [Juglans microcarpa x Juglans regia]
MSIVEMIVHMDCAGCESKIKKALRKLDGVNEVDIDLTMQKVTVMGWVEQEKVLKTVRKMGRRADQWPYPQDPEYYNIMRQYNYHHQHHDLHDQNQSLTYYVSLPDSSYNDYIQGHSSTTAQLGYGSYDDQHHHESLSSSYDDQQPPYSTMYRDQNDWQATAIFNDENPHACSIM